MKTQKTKTIVSMPIAGKLLSLKEFCEFASVSVRTGQRLIEERQIGFKRIRGQIRIPLNEIEKYLAKDGVDVPAIDGREIAREFLERA